MGKSANVYIPSNLSKIGKIAIFSGLGTIDMIERILDLVSHVHNRSTLFDFVYF